MSLEKAKMKSLADKLNSDADKAEEDKDGVYYCEECERNHSYDSKIGKKHNK